MTAYGYVFLGITNGGSTGLLFSPSWFKVQPFPSDKKGTKRNRERSPSQGKDWSLLFTLSAHIRKTAKCEERTRTYVVSYLAL